ncbi:MAG: hypothetical protein V3W04_07285 [Gammaproteobacteria bacterium]
MSFRTLKPAELYTRTNPKEIGYNSTADIDTAEYEIIGQSRALAGC